MSSCRVRQLINIGTSSCCGASGWEKPRIKLVNTVVQVVGLSVRLQCDGDLATLSPVAQLQRN